MCVGGGGSLMLFIKSLLGASAAIPPTHTHSKQIQFLAHHAKQTAEGLAKSDPGGDHYNVGCLSQKCVLLPKQLMSDHLHSPILTKENHHLCGRLH